MRNSTLSPTDARLPGMLLFAMGAVVVLFFLLNVAMRFSAVSIWDDAYFFTRYADNYRHAGTYSWNEGAAPSYGLTSVAYGAWVYLLRLLGGAQPLSLWVSSLTWGIAALAAVWMIARLHDRAGATGRQAMTALFLLMVGLDALQLSVHFSSGMDTTFAMAWVGAYLYFSKRYEGRLSPGKALLLGLLGGVAWFIRPDLLLFPFLLPLSQVFFSQRPLQRKMAGYILLFTTFMVLLLMGLGLQNLGGFLPLSFYVKSLNSYGAGMSRAYSLAGLRQLGLFLLSCAPLIILLPWAWRASRHKREVACFSRLDKSLLLGLLVFLGYHAFLVTPIMGYHQRFLHPIWPLVVYLCCRSLEIILLQQPERATPLLQRPRLPALLLLLIVGALSVTTVVQRPANLRTTFADMRLSTAYNELGRNNWPYLPEFVALGDQMSFASTELGILGAVASGHTVYDLAGLHDEETAREGLDATRLLTEQRPDLIYMPHPDYEEMTARIREHPAFQEGYREYTPQELHSWLGVAIRKESPFFVAMEHIVARGNFVEEQTSP